MNKSATLPLNHTDHAERRGMLLGFIGVAMVMIGLLRWYTRCTRITGCSLLPPA